MMADSTLLEEKARAVFDCLDREIWIVTAATENQRGGLVATWVMQASLDPQTPSLLAGIGINHFTRELIDAAGGFAAHLISAAQVETAWRFGLGSGRDRDKLSGIDSTTAETGAPILRNCLAWLDCRVFHRQEAGDRVFYWGDVVAADQFGSAKPLREQELFKLASDEQRKHFRAELEADIQVQRPRYAAWRARLADESQ